MTTHSENEIPLAPKAHASRLWLGALGVAALAVILLAILTNQLPPIWPDTTPTHDVQSRAFDVASQRWMAISAVVTALISAGTFALLAWTLLVTREMLREASETTRHAEAASLAARDTASTAEAAKEITKRQVQANVHASDVNCKIAALSNAKIEFKKAIITCRNDGLTQAANIVLRWRVQAIANTQRGAQEPPDFSLPMNQSDLPSLAGSTFSKWVLAPENIYLGPASFVRIYGQVFYRTVFDEHKMSQFCLDLTWPQAVNSMADEMNFGTDNESFPRPGEAEALPNFTRILLQFHPAPLTDTGAPDYNAQP